MKSRIKLLLLTMLFCCIKFLSAQEKLAIYEMKYGNDYYREDTSKNEFNMSVIFKINQPEKALKIYIGLGNSTDSTVIINGEYEVLFKDEHYGFWVSNNFTSFWNKRVNVIYKVLKNDLKNINWITVYAENIDKSLTEKQYMECDYQYHFKK